jgi:hypothetical protein
MQNSSQTPPKSNIAFLSRFKSHRPENFTAFLLQQPMLVLMPGVRMTCTDGPTTGF